MLHHVQYSIIRVPPRCANSRGIGHNLVERCDVRSIPERKICRKCGKLLPSSTFGRRSDSSDGLKSWCQPCIRTYSGQVKRPTRSPWVVGEIGYIPLTQGKVAIVDADALPILQGVWCFDKIGYAVKRNPSTGGRVSMHRIIVGVEGDKDSLIDHINGNMLDNRRENLRVATKGENAVNVRRNRADNKTGYRGVVCNSKERGYWFARFTWQGVTRYSCGHRSPEAAARAYDTLVKQHGPALAYLNFPEEVKP